MRITIISKALGIILTAFGVIILLPIVFAIIEKAYSTAIPFLVASGCSLVLGLACYRYGNVCKNFDSLKRSEGLLIVTLTWVVSAAIGAIPYLFFGLSPLDAYFESVSGFTTTGATILTDFSRYHDAFFFWRGLTQWLGGMGIIVLFVAILPQFGVAGRKIFFAEAPGPSEDKITPRIAHTAKALWLIYVVLTVLQITALTLVGMPFFDALCNSLSTMAAGGFSPHPQSIMGYGSPAITWVVTFFMLLAGANFALQYKFFIQRKIQPLFTNDEFRFYCTVILFASLLLCAFLFIEQQNSLSVSIRDSIFQVVSVVTTTGFSSADFALWLVPAQTILFAMMLIGGCAGSAGGGIKMVRVLFAFRFLKREIDQTVHPKAILPIKIDKTSIPDDIQRQMLSFLLFYMVILIVSGLVVTIIEHNPAIGFVGTAATIGNVGPGFGEIGPMGSFGGLHPLTKSIFIFDMIVGRLELIPFLVMLCPDFWSFSRS